MKPKKRVKRMSRGMLFDNNHSKYLWKLFANIWLKIDSRRVYAFACVSLCWCLHLWRLCESWTLFAYLQVFHWFFEQKHTLTHARNPYSSTFYKLSTIEITIRFWYDAIFHFRSFSIIGSFLQAKGKRSVYTRVHRASWREKEEKTRYFYHY